MTTVVKPRSARQAAVLYGWTAATLKGFKSDAFTPQLLAFIADWSHLTDDEVLAEVRDLLARGFDRHDLERVH